MFCRDNDQDTISICDSTCRQVLQSAEGMEYHELRYYGTTDIYDNGTSTPDHCTTASEANASMTTSFMGMTSSHLAQQEPMLSDDSFSVSMPISKTGSVLEGQGDVANVDLDNVELRLADIAKMSSEMADYTEQMRIIYQEEESDNSCVVNVENGDT